MERGDEKCFSVPPFRAKRDERVFGNHVVKGRDGDHVINKVSTEEVFSDHADRDMDISCQETTITRITLNTKTHQVQHELMKC
jgi:hypothetical protein